jgi:hypothetical protein
MAKVQVSCPRCRQPLVAEIEQLFDVGQDPQAKQRFLSGQSNVIDCKKCGYQGPLSVPLVYHDPDKELLLTYFPAELGLPVNEQERLVGPFIKQVVDKLPPEKRKGYLLRPQGMLTLQTMLDRVLEGEGITRDQIEKSQKRLNLIQRLISTSSKEIRAEIVQQEESLVDEAFFTMISRLVEASLSNGDQNSARALAGLQQEILPLTEVGRRLKAESDEVQAAVKELQEAGQKGLTRDILLDVILKNRDKPAIVNALASMTRQGMDYEFFNLLTKRIDQAAEDEKPGLAQLRDRLLALVQQMDKQVQEQMSQAKQLLEEILRAPNVEHAATEHLQEMDEFFAEVLRNELQEARKKGDYDRSGRIQALFEVIQKASAPPPEYEFIEQLISLESEAERRDLLEKNADQLTPELLQMMSGLATQMETEGQAEIAGRLQDVYRIALRFSMERKMKQQ